MRVRPQILCTLSLLLVISTSFATGPGEGFLGRWDLTVTSTSAEYPSWLEVSRADGKLMGRFVGRSGSVRPAEVQLVGEEIQFAPERPPRAKTQTAESYKGRLVAGKLEGTGADNQGNPVRWVGMKAVHRPAPPREPRWGTPVSLFNGRDLEGWTFKSSRGRECWFVEQGILVNKPPCPNIYSLQQFRDFKLHVEYNLDSGSNSGVYLRGRYEVQIADQGPRELDSHGVGAIYGFLAPTAKAAKKASEWQAFDITLIGYRVTVVFNGKTIIDNQEIDGITGGALNSNEAAPGPIMLQGDHGRVQFRNIVGTPGN